MVILVVKNFFRRIFGNIFKRRKNLSLGFYGPPNAGKCVTPETEVVLINGEIKQINEIFDEAKKSKKIDDYQEGYIEVSDSNIILPTFDIKSFKIIPKKVSHVYSQRYEGE